MGWPVRGHFGLSMEYEPMSKLATSLASTFWMSETLLFMGWMFMTVRLAPREMLCWWNQCPAVVAWWYWCNHMTRMLYMWLVVKIYKSITTTSPSVEMVLLMSLFDAWASVVQYIIEDLAKLGALVRSMKSLNSLKEYCKL